MNNQPSQGPSVMDRERERELDELHMRERHMLRQQEEIAQREREHNERERQHREQPYQPVPQHQNNTGAIPIHQPVASRLPGAIHSPGGLLANHGGTTSSAPLGAPAGPGNAFGGPLHSEGNRLIQHNQNAVSQQQQHQMFAPSAMNHNQGSAAALGPPAGPTTVFGGPLQQDPAARAIQQIPFGGPGAGNHQIPGAPALGQGQQPILNDALSYLDQVKVQFVDQPDVYNRFLDIMKDFKSQAIDTPGVINRVSELFAGHPNLIQGFNTFLPPGYRIECGAGNDPNTIRVTTPMGTTVQSITGGGRAALPDTQIGGNGPYYAQRGNSWQQQPQHSTESPEAVFSPQSRNGAPAYGQNQGSNTAYEAQQAAAAHQQEQRGVSQLQNAAIAATGQGIPRTAVTPTPGVQSVVNGAGPQQPGIEKRGPVEFNHAISYVNKIKNRFQDRPEIYKQFLEILQTYQRESKPIQDVYAQVTTLFSTAPDLLEDFKQFLPESAAQAKAAAKAAEDAAALAGVSQTPQPATRGDQKLPPVGNFPPPSTSKEGKKRTRPSGSATTMSIGNLGEGANTRNSIGQAGNLSKRAKLSHSSRPQVEDVPAVSPTLTPLKPQPMSPALVSTSQHAEVTFFDKVKKYLSNKQTFAEFLKLCNLFSQDLIDKNVLVHKVSNFIGTNLELMEFFKKFVQYTGTDEITSSPLSESVSDMASYLNVSYMRAIAAEGLPFGPSPNDFLFRRVARPQKVKHEFYVGNCSAMSRFDPSTDSFQNYLHVPHIFCIQKRLSEELAGPVSKKARLSKSERNNSGEKEKRLIGRQRLTRLRGDKEFYGTLANEAQERLKTCSGRDEMCNSVLNDDWASHPTWASEDSGFVAHRKNIFEEALHRIEEERHDYDFNIEANAKVIQLLEPVGAQILALQPHEYAGFRMPAGFGGSSQSIYKRILKKIYGPEKGTEVASDLFKDPIAVLPVVLARLKQKDEEWRFTQREWEKVWHAQTGAMYLKSLDHMGIHVKQSDKKIFSPKNIVDLIKLKHEEQRRHRSLKGKVSRYQFSYDFNDHEVIMDATRLTLIYVIATSQHNTSEKDRLMKFFAEFVPVFFGINSALVTHRIADLLNKGSESQDNEDAGPAEALNGRGRRINGTDDLRRGVLDKARNGTKGRGHKEDSLSGSKESTPDIGSAIEDEEGDDIDTVDDGRAAVTSPERWLARDPAPAALVGTQALEAADLELKADQPFMRNYYNLYCNQTIFVFFTLFEILYRRLKTLKNDEEAAHEEFRRFKTHKPAKEIGLMDKERDDIFKDNQDETYYARTLGLIESFVENNVDEAKYQDILRTYYLKNGWMVYTIQELLRSICRMATVCSVNDAKEKTNDIIKAFISTRGAEDTTYNAEIEQRKKVEKIVKDGDMFLIRYFPQKQQATAQLILKDETTFELTDMERKERWKYYTSSYVRIEPTEGVPRDRVRKSVLTRNIPTGETESEDGTPQTLRKPLLWDEELVLRICVNTYKLTYKKDTAEWFVYADTKPDAEKLKRQRDARNERFREKFSLNSKWMKNLQSEEVNAIKRDYKIWIDKGLVPGSAAAAAYDFSEEEPVVAAGTKEKPT